MQDFVPRAQVKHEKSTSYFANVKKPNLDMWKHIITLEKLNTKIHQKSQRYLFDNDLLKQIKEELRNRISKDDFADFAELYFLNQLKGKSEIHIPEELVNILLKLSKSDIKTEDKDLTLEALKIIEKIFECIGDNHMRGITYDRNTYNSDDTTNQFYPEEKDVTNALQWFNSILIERKEIEK